MCEALWPHGNCARLGIGWSGFEPRPGTLCVVLLGKTFYSLCTSLHQAPVVQRLDNTKHQINRYPVDKCQQNKTNHAIRWIVIYPVNSVNHFSNNPGQVYKWVPAKLMLVITLQLTGIPPRVTELSKVPRFVKLAQQGEENSKNEIGKYC